MRFSVSLVADGDREMTIDEIVELADAVAAHGGIASGIGSPSYGAQIVVEAPTSDEAVEVAIAEFVAAAKARRSPRLAGRARRDDRRRGRRRRGR